MKKLAIILILAVFSYTLWATEGQVKNNLNQTISGATVTFTNINNPSLRYTVKTDDTGYYKIDLPQYEVFTNSYFDFRIFWPYPNPFGSKVIIPIIIKEASELNVVIYDIQGRIVKSFAKKTYPAGVNYFEWDGKNNIEQEVLQGVYFYRVIYQNKEYSGKMVKINQSKEPAGYIVQDTSIKIDTVQIPYKIEVVKSGYDTFIFNNFRVIDREVQNFILFIDFPVPYACVDDYLAIYDGTKYRPYFIKAINLGAALPGTYPGELSATSEDYRRWINLIAEAGFNTIRLYTLHYPRFYEEFIAYNLSHPENPLYLLHGVWLTENIPNGNLYSVNNEFEGDIEEIVDCVHGNNEIGERFGKAFGTYTVDVSNYVIGYIAGREVFPDEILYTDKVNNVTSFIGKHFTIQNCSASEAWITAKLDKIVEYEKVKYGVERPVCFSSWPTLDPIYHENEHGWTDEDTAQVDLSKIQIKSAPAGYFVSYHAYPYYPNFISVDSIYRTYSDNFGPNNYLGYLADLKSHYGKTPLVIAETGVPSSWGSAHFSYSKMNHGGNDEETQGVYDARLMHNVYDMNCAGFGLFAWIDEWFKITWITNPIGSTPDRRMLWHNLTSPEQNFGLIAFEQIGKKYEKLSFFVNNCDVLNIDAKATNSALYLKVKFKNNIVNGDQINIGFDTYQRNVGESLLKNGQTVANRAEFCLDIKIPDSANLYVTQAYDLFEIWFKNWSDPRQYFHTDNSDSGLWNLVRWRNDEAFADAIDSLGRLRIRADYEDSTSLDAVVYSKNTLEIKIPWTLINFVDPSNLEVMDDLRWTSERETYETDGIIFQVSKNNCTIETTTPFIWEKWNYGDKINYVERIKPSFKHVKNALGQLPDYK